MDSIICSFYGKNIIKKLEEGGRIGSGHVIDRKFFPKQVKYAIIIDTSKQHDNIKSGPMLYNWEQELESQTQSYTIFKSRVIDILYY